jgi:hypothetical protein
MITTTILLATALAGQTQIEPAHARNTVFKEVLDKGLESGGHRVTLPRPSLTDGQDAQSQRAVLHKLAGSNTALDNLLRDSVFAPFIIKVRDLKAKAATIRIADVWFIVYAELDQVDFGQEASRTDQKAVDVANMFFETRLLKEDDLRAAQVKTPSAASAQNQWYAHVHARLLDRIDFAVTNLIVASQSPESIVVASRTDPTFAGSATLPNSWKSLPRQGQPAARKDETPKPYQGGISYAKISRLAVKPGALLVEMHTAYVEPDGWFQGAPILRSKFSVVAQDQIRSLRRTLASKREK